MDKGYIPDDFERDAQVFENVVPDSIFPGDMLEPMRNYIRRLVIAYLQNKPGIDENKKTEFINKLVSEMTALTATFITDAKRAEADYLRIKKEQTAAQAQISYDQFVTATREAAIRNMRDTGVIGSIQELTSRLPVEQQATFLAAVIANAQNLSFQQSGIAERHPCLDMESHAADILQQLKEAIVLASSSAVSAVNEVRGPLAAVMLGAVAVPLMGPMALVPVLGLYATSEAGDKLAGKGVIPVHWRYEAALGVKNIISGTCEMLSGACGGLAAGAKNTTILSKYALLSLMTNASNTARAVVSDVRNAVDFTNICREWAGDIQSDSSSSSSQREYTDADRADAMAEWFPSSPRGLGKRSSVVFENLPPISDSQDSNFSYKTGRSGISSISTIAQEMALQLSSDNIGGRDILDAIIDIDENPNIVLQLQQEDPEFFAKYPILSGIDDDTAGGRRRRGRKSRRYKKKRSTLKRRGLKRRRTRKGKKRRHTKKRR